MLSDSEYKEQYRLDMIKWSDEMRDQDYGCFCREACQNGISKSLLFYFDFRMNNLNIFEDFICALNWYKTICIHYLFHEITIEGISEAKILSLIVILKKKKNLCSGYFKIASIIEVCSGYLFAEISFLSSCTPDILGCGHWLRINSDPLCRSNVSWLI